MMLDTLCFVVTCEHAGNRIPPAYRRYFRGWEGLLRSHRGYDGGALVMARELAAASDAPLLLSTTSRLLIDLNRSVGHPRLYSEATREAPADVRREILRRYYLPHRSRTEAQIAAAVGRGLRVIHVASHTFTPELHGEVRNADIGLLYDPLRSREQALCRSWQAAIVARAPELKVRRNYPYTGHSDGFTTYLRRCFPGDAYLGIELEINQKHVVPRTRSWRNLRDTVIQALKVATVEVAGG